MEGLVLNTVESPVENWDKEKIGQGETQDMKKTRLSKLNITHSISYIYRYKKKMHHQAYKICAYIKAVNPEPNDL